MGKWPIKREVARSAFTKLPLLIRFYRLKLNNEKLIHSQPKPQKGVTEKEKTLQLFLPFKEINSQLLDCGNLKRMGKPFRGQSPQLSCRRRFRNSKERKGKEDGEEGKRKKKI